MEMNVFEWSGNIYSPHHANRYQLVHPIVYDSGILSRCLRRIDKFPQHLGAREKTAMIERSSSNNAKKVSGEHGIISKFVPGL